MIGEDEVTFRIEFPVPGGATSEITYLQAASMALDFLTAEEAAAAAEYLAGRYRRMCQR